MFPGKTEIEEFISHLESEYNDQVYKIGGKDFTFSVTDGIITFEYSFNSGKEKQEEQINEEEEEGIEFDDKTLLITADLFAGNSKYTIYTLKFIDEKKKIKKIIKLTTTQYKFQDDNFIDSKNFFELSEKKIKVLLKKLIEIIKKK